MKQTIRFQRASIFRRICSIIFDGIILVTLLMIVQAFICMPIISISTDYDKKYDQYISECIDSHLYIMSGDYSNNVKLISKDEQFIVFYNDNNIGLTISDYNKIKLEQTYVKNNQTYNLFVEDEIGSNNYVENIVSNQEIKEALANERSKFYSNLANDLYNKFLEHENNKEFKELTIYLSGLISLSYVISLIISTLVTYLLFPMIFKDRATLGKKMFHFEIIDLRTGQIASRFWVFARFVFFALTGIVLGLFSLGATIIISLLIIPLSKKRQTLHDLMAKTVVVNIDINTENEREIFTLEYDEKNNDVVDVEVVEKKEDEESSSLE